MPSPYAHLAKADARLAPVIESSGPFELESRPFDSAFEPLARSVVYQQLSGTAARSIYERLVTRFGDGSRPSAAQVLDADPESLRSVGLSRQKAAYLRGLAQAVDTGEMPDRAELEVLEDESIIEQLTRFKGIGRWTVEMLLIFWMGRPDVLPVDDLGIRKGVKVIDQLPELPSPQEVLDRGGSWRPYRSVASWYLWRAAES